MFLKHYETFFEASATSVLDAITVWCLKPQVVNRQLTGCIYLHNVNEDGVFSEASLRKALQVSSLSVDLKELFGVCGHCLTATNVQIIVRKMVPRDLNRHGITIEIVLITHDEFSVEALFIPLIPIENRVTTFQQSYFICYNNETKRLGCSIHCLFDRSTHPSALLLSDTWLTQTLLSKLRAWALASHQSSEPLRKTQTVSLINIEEYSRVYSKLKQKYAAYFVKIWPESTDPLKFVHEDIAIATYLLLLWSDERKVHCLPGKQSFVDLGCGNGLLVHLLISEGHPGRGVDVARRKIWGLFGEGTTLEEAPIDPQSLVVREDWIIGNHSDELTPWIPVIAARSSYNTRYFLLPCCPFDFYSKFRRLNTKSSQYQAYLEYIRRVGDECGFIIQQDVLRIPSTKRICHVARARSCAESEVHRVELQIDSLLKSSQSFTPRIINNDPKNCSRVDDVILCRIADAIVERLLVADGVAKMTNGGRFGGRVTSCHVPLCEWNPGAEVHLSELSKLFDRTTLHALKDQCGGLQTLLKNRGYVFKVASGFVSLRDYRCCHGNPRSSSNKRKTKVCWFYEKHPQGCVLPTIQCAYAHGVSDLNTL